ncbi:unnamed protein product [Echinostoma caproni]|uniref:Integrase catalytic domain-containing protein n=1 Tax=Echinostoma caproni TaxID=27848 RepID=A0A183BF98_9TREM|nr:unnamed protein product [Echinostoma caproni]
MLSSTVINCLCQLFAIFGMPAYVHSDRGPSFMSAEVVRFLRDKGVATSHTTAYNPQGNGRVERLNGTLWKAISLALRTRGLPTSQWEMVLPDALHSIRSLLCVATNNTPHERLFSFPRRSVNGSSIPTWLTTPGPVLLKRMDRTSKYDNLVEEVDLISCNPHYALVKMPNGREENVSIRRLAPPGDLMVSRPETCDLPDSKTHTELETPPPKSTGNSLNHEILDPSPAPTPVSDSASEILQQQQRTRPYNLRNREAYKNTTDLPPSAAYASQPKRIYSGTREARQTPWDNSHIQLFTQRIMRRNSPQGPESAVCTQS